MPLPMPLLPAAGLPSAVPGCPTAAPRVVLGAGEEASEVGLQDAKCPSGYFRSSFRKIGWVFFGTVVSREALRSSHRYAEAAHPNVWRNCRKYGLSLRHWSASSSGMALVPKSPSAPQPPRCEG